MPRARRRARRQQAGFTLIEMMFVVAIIAILAAIAVPIFTEETNKGKARSEVVAFFAEFAVRQEQYRVDNRVYLATAACPAAPSLTLQPMTGCVGAGNPWQPLNVALPTQSGYCSYQTVVGNTTGTNNPGGFVFASIALPWFYIIATCEMDGNAGNSTYFTSSIDSTIQSLNEGS